MAPKQPPDDLLDGRIPDPDAEPSAAELAHAKTFANLVDKTLAGRPPAAMSTDDRALLEVATVIRAVSGNAELSSAKQRSLVEDALRQAVGGGVTGVSSSLPITRMRAKRAPWIVAAASMLVAAAALLLWLRAPRQVVTTMRAPAIPETWKSRPADALVGPIGREHAGDASARLDTIFADRLDGYRERRLRGEKP
ncbi:hypothetical protein BH11MYX1_BH11MYX1_50130 [soil metagenome]